MIDKAPKPFSERSGLRQKFASFQSSPFYNRIARGVGANAYSQVVTIAVQLITTPILIHTWGVEAFGLWLTISAIPSYLSLTDFGLSQVTASSMAMKAAVHDQQGLREVYSSASLVLWLLVLGVGGAGLLCIFLLPINDWLSAGGGVDVRWVLLLLAAQALTAILSGLYGAGLRAGGRYAFLTAINATCRLGMGVGVALVALSGAHLVTAALVMLIVQLVFTTMTAFFMGRTLPDLKFRLRDVKLDEIRDATSPSLGFGAYTLGNLLNIQGVTIVVGLVLGPIAVASLGVARTLCRLGVAAGNMFAHALQSEYSAMVGARNLELHRSMFRNHVRFSLALAVVYFLGVAALGGYVIKIWTGGKIDVPAALLITLAGGCALEILWMAFFTPLIASNTHNRAGVLYLAVSLLSLLFVWLLAGRMGVAVAGWCSVVVGGVMLAICFSASRASARSLRFEEDLS